LRQDSDVTGHRYLGELVELEPGRPTVMKLACEIRNHSVDVHKVKYVFYLICTASSKGSPPGYQMVLRYGTVTYAPTELLSYAVPRYIVVKHANSSSFHFWPRYLIRQPYPNHLPSFNLFSFKFLSLAGGVVAGASAAGIGVKMIGASVAVGAGAAVGGGGSRSVNCRSGDGSPTGTVMIDSTPLMVTVIDVLDFVGREQYPISTQFRPPMP
jgi:hypothetical protein